MYTFIVLLVYVIFISKILAAFLTQFRMFSLMKKVVVEEIFQVKNIHAVLLRMIYIQNVNTCGQEYSKLKYA